MRKILSLLLLVGCTTAPKLRTTSQAIAERSDHNDAAIAQITTVGYTYFLIPSQALLEAEYDIQRNMLENLPVEDSRLRRWAFEAAVGMIASTLDSKYGDHVDGEILPSSQVIIVRSDQEIDLSILKDLIVDLNGEKND